MPSTVLCVNERGVTLCAMSGLAVGFLAPNRAFISENCFGVTPTPSSLPKPFPIQKRKIPIFNRQKIGLTAFLDANLKGASQMVWMNQCLELACQRRISGEFWPKFQHVTGQNCSQESGL